MLALYAVLHLIASLAMIAGLAVFAVRSLITGIVWLGGTAAWLFSLSRTGQWAVIGWWWPYVLWGLFLIAGMLLLAKWLRSSRFFAPAGTRGWIGLSLAGLLLVSGGYVGQRTTQARPESPVETVDITSPFATGQFVVASGGFDPLVNPHLATLDQDIERYRNWRGQSYAIDFFEIGSMGLRAEGLQPEDPARYAIFGAEVVTPCAGRVIATQNELPDLRVPQRDEERKLGNYVILRCGAAIIVLAHFQRNSVSVSPGQHVEAGTPMGRVGNSGNSGEPHLHIHAQREAPADQPISGEPMALRIDGRYLRRGDRFTAGSP